MSNGPPLEHHFVDTNGVRLHVVQAGPDDGPLVLLLHGFPEFWYGWRHQIAMLAAAGYRVWAPDQRGYGESSKPKGVRNYTMDRLTDDVLGLISASGRDRAHVVGHDWGGAVAWRLAARHPDRVERLAVLNCPHPRVMARNLMRNPSQTARSAYIFFFQLPILPERLLRARNFALLERGMRRTSRQPAVFGDEEMARYREAWSRPDALRSMIHWYRAVRRGVARGGGRRITVPTLLLWGSRDRFLAPTMAEQSIAMCDDGRLAWLENATHWLQHEEPERVSETIVGFFRGRRRA